MSLASYEEFFFGKSYQSAPEADGISVAELDRSFFHCFDKDSSCEGGILYLIRTQTTTMPTNRSFLRASGITKVFFSGAAVEKFSRQRLKFSVATK